MSEPLYSEKEAQARAKPGQTVRSVFRSYFQILGTPNRPRPWEEEASTGVWAWPELWQEVSPNFYEEKHKAEGLGAEYDPTLPTDVPDYPSLAGAMDDLLNLRKREGRRKGRASTRVTQGDLGELSLSNVGLFPL